MLSAKVDISPNYAFLPTSLGTPLCHYGRLPWHGTQIVVEELLKNTQIFDSMSNEKKPEDMFQNLKEGFSEFGKKMGSFMDDVLGGSGDIGDVQVRSDIYTVDGQYIIELELPGVNKEDVGIQIHEGVLSVKGEKKYPPEVVKRSYDRKDRQFGSIRTDVRLPLDVELENIKAKYDSGILTIRLNRPNFNKKSDESEIDIE